MSLRHSFACLVSI